MRTAWLEFYREQVEVSHPFRQKRGTDGAHALKTGFERRNRVFRRPWVLFGWGLGVEPGGENGAGLGVFNDGRDAELHEVGPLDGAGVEQDGVVGL